MSSTIRVPIGALGEAVEKVLTVYSKEVTEEIKKSAKVRTEEMVAETKSTAPQNRPKYYKKIKSELASETANRAIYRWYVAGSEYRLSHLLEFGHAKKSGGRTKAANFITPAADKAVTGYTKDVEEAIRNGANK